MKGRFACGIATGTLLALVGLRIQALLATKNAKAPVVVDAGAPASGVVGAGAGAGVPTVDAGEQQVPQFLKGSPMSPTTRLSPATEGPCAGRKCCRCMLPAASCVILI